MFDDEIAAIEITYKLRGGIDHQGSAQGSEYHLLLQLDPKIDDSWIRYYVTNLKGKSRKLSRYETDQLIDKVRQLTPKLPQYRDMAVVVDPPPAFIELRIKFGSSLIDMNWFDDYWTYDDSDTIHPADVLIDLISQVEPMDYEGLGVEPFKWL